MNEELLRCSVYESLGSSQSVISKKYTTLRIGAISRQVAMFTVFPSPFGRDRLRTDMNYPCCVQMLGRGTLFRELRRYIKPTAGHIKIDMCENSPMRGMACAFSHIAQATGSVKVTQVPLPF